MNRIDPDYFLGGKIKLDKEKALTEIKEKIADPSGMDPYQAAEAICRIIDGKMLIALKGFIASKGIDSAKYPLISYGGLGPAHCAAYADGLGFSKIIIPPFASVFSAWGASTADIRHMYEGAPFITMGGFPYDSTTSRFKTEEIESLSQIPQWAIDRFNSMYEGLEQLAMEDMRAEGISPSDVMTSHECEARYGGQLWEIRMPLSISRLKSVEDLRTILLEFEKTFLSVYGPLSMLPRGGIQILKLAVVTTASITKVALPAYESAGPDSSGALKDERQVYVEGKFVPAKIYDMRELRTGNTIDGTAIIEAVDTTIFVPRRCRVTVDEYLNMVMVYR
jgi:N-methylhydantoinase A